MSDQISALIPARLNSSRLPRKVLIDINGHPLIWYVWKQIQQAKSIDLVFITTDSPEVRDVANSFGANVIMSSPDCQSGTDRIASIITQVESSFILNIQGDEPLIDPMMLDALINQWKSNPCELITPVYKIRNVKELISPNIVKVVRSSDGRAIYFSRSPIPYLRDFPMEAWLDHSDFWGHIGVYGYKRNVLINYNNLPVSHLEKLERLEQLRFLEAGYTFHTIETEYRPNAVDIPDDLERVKDILQRKNN